MALYICLASTEYDLWNKESEMNKSELIENMSQKANINISKSEEVIDLFFSSIAKTLRDRGRVEIRGFGAITVKNYKGYLGRNPKTGRRIEVKEKSLPVWRTGLELKKRVDG